MRTRINKWLDTAGKRDPRVLYGVDVLVNGRWHHAHRNGTPLIFRTEVLAQAERAKLRKAALLMGKAPTWARLGTK